MTLVYLYHVIAVDTTKNCRLQSWTLYKSADCRWISITILCVSFTNSATVGRLEQVQLCNRLIDQSADNITGLKCVKECHILKYKYIQNPWWHSYTFTTYIAVDTTNNYRLQSWALYKSADCRWISITILCVSFTNSATVGRLEQVQLCNRLIDQSADNITGLKCTKECLILK